MHKINLKKPLTVFGNPAHDGSGAILINEAIANCLIQGRTSNPAKNMSICLRLHDQGELELDDHDLEFLKSTINQCQTATDLLIGTVLKEIEEQTKKAE
jgi:hypothetical protein